MIKPSNIMKPGNSHLELIFKWLRYKDHINLEKVLKKLLWRKIAIYGGGVLGGLLYENLSKTDIQIVCVIDRNIDAEFPYEADIVTTEQFTASGLEADAVIVCLVDYFAACHELSSHISSPIVPLEYLIADIDLLRCFRETVNHIERSGVVLHFLDITDPVRWIRNPSVTEQRLLLQHTPLEAYTRSEAALKLLTTYYDDLPDCNEEYVREVFEHEGINFYIANNGVRYIQDINSKYYNVTNGARFTADCPQKCDNAIHLFGDCRAFGFFTDDSHTIASFLQQTLNISGLKNLTWRVWNHSNWQGVFESMRQILHTAFKTGDILLILAPFTEQLRYYSDSASVYFHSFRSVFDRPHGMGELFFDGGHINHRGYKIVADKIYEILTGFDTNVTNEPGPPKFSVNLPRERQKLSAEGNPPPDLRNYIEFLSREKVDCVNGVVGAIVVNCNPFTLGHKFLMEEALKLCDFLYVFVVEEDRSFFPFADRLELVKTGTAELQRLKLLRSGTCFISMLTVPEYFCRNSVPDAKLDASMDMRIFAESIAPVLGITRRFAGEEPIDPVTRQYTQAMLDILPPRGIEVTIIPRKMWAEGIPISASYVRKLLKERDFYTISQIVPPTTLNYLRER